MHPRTRLTRGNMASVGVDKGEKRPGRVPKRPAPSDISRRLWMKAFHQGWGEGGHMSIYTIGMAARHGFVGELPRTYL